MMFYIYKIINTINNKIYIGKTNKVGVRFKNHIAISRGDAPYYYLHRAMKKYGQENFIVNTIAETNDEQYCFILEMKCIAFYKSNDSKFGYNLNSGGVGGKKEMNRTKRKPMAYKKSTWYRGKMHASYGKSHSEERKKQIAQSMIGEKNHFYGKKHSDETKIKISKAGKGRKHSQESRNKIIEAQLGTKRTEQSKNKMSKSIRKIIDSGNHKAVKLNWDKVNKIREMIKNGIPIPSIAKDFGVCRATISAIKHNKNWKI